MDDNHPSDRIIRIFADLPGICVQCGEPIDEDTMILYDRMDGSMAHFIYPELVAAMDALEARLTQRQRGK